MALKTTEIHSTLNDLIQICKDGEQGFNDCAEHAQSLDLRETFRRSAATRAAFAAELQTEVARLGGKPETSGTATGALHRGWLNLREKLSSPDDHALLEEAERGEDSAVKAYRDALAKDTPGDIRQIIERQYQTIFDTHDQIREMRDATEPVRTRTSGL